MLLFPLFYFIHDLEEILTVETFLFNHSDTISFRLTTRQFTFAFLLLWILSSFKEESILRNGASYFLFIFSTRSLFSQRWKSLHSIHYYKKLCSRYHYIDTCHLSIFFFYSYILVQREINNDEKIYVVSMFRFYFTNSFCTFIPLVFRIIVLIYGDFTLKRVIHLNLQRKHSLDFYLRFRVM